MRRIVIQGAAIACIVAVSSCAANSQFTSAGQSNRATTSHVDRLPESFRHGAEIETGSTFMVSEGNYHAAFPAGAKLVRTPQGIVVTYKGTTRTFSPTARVDFGTYHRYAKASSE